MVYPYGYRLGAASVNEPARWRRVPDETTMHAGEQRWGAEAWWVGGLWLVVCRGVVGGWAMVGGLHGASTTSV